MSRISRAQAEYQIAARMQHVDVWFEISAEGVERAAELGVLGRMGARGDGIIEVFSRTPTCKQYRRCVRRQLVLEQQRDAVQSRRVKERAKAVRAAEARLRRRAAEARGESTLPRLWVLSPGRPVRVIRSFGMKRMKGWPAGFFAPNSMHAQALVVLSELPRTRATLLLRLQGQRATFDAAIEDLSKLPATALERQMVAADLLALRQEVTHDQGERKQMSATVKRIEAMYQEWENEVRAQGMKQGLRRGVKQGLRRGVKQGLRRGVKQGTAQGHADGLRQALAMILAQRFGEVPVHVRARMDAADAAELGQWVGRAVQAKSLEDSLPQPDARTKQARTGAARRRAVKAAAARK